MANLYKRWLCDESLKTLSSRPILIYFELRSKPSLIRVTRVSRMTGDCQNGPLLAHCKKFIATKYCFLILGDDTSFFFFVSLSVFFVCLFVFLFLSFFFVFMLCYLFCYYKFLQKLFSIYCSFYYLLLLLLFS